MGSKTSFDTFEVEELPSDLTHWRNAFDARFLRFEALQGKPRTVLITNAQWLKSSNKTESKRQLLITLQEFEKPWAINVTNSETIAKLYANDDPHSWVGKRVTLYPTKTKFGREVVDCIRVREQIPEEPKRQQAPGQQQSKGAPRPEITAYLQRMADTLQPEELDGVEESLTEDNTLSQEETALLVRALTKRRAQLGNAEAK